jgi:hypothetical protein
VVPLLTPVTAVLIMFTSFTSFISYANKLIIPKEGSFNSFPPACNI